MLAPALHPLGGDGPKPLDGIDLIPARADALASPCRGQNRELERASGNTLLLLHLGHDLVILVIGQRGMVLDSADLAALRQQVFEMPAPPRRILALTITARLSPIQNRLYASANSPGCFRLRCPNRLDRLHHQPDVNRLNRQIAEEWV